MRNYWKPSINALLAITNAWRDFHVYILLYTVVGFASVKRSRACFALAQREHPRRGLSCRNTSSKGDREFMIYQEVFNEPLSLVTSLLCCDVYVWGPHEMWLIEVLNPPPLTVWTSTVRCWLESGNWFICYHIFLKQKVTPCEAVLAVSELLKAVEFHLFANRY